MGRLALGSLIILLILGLISFLLLELRRGLFFKLEEVIIYGNHRAKESEIIEMVGVRVGSSLLKIRLEEIECRVKRNPWVKEAVARLIPPGRLTITVEERRPVAILKRDRFFYVDEAGEVFKELDGSDGVGYPILTGEASRELILEALNLIKVSQEFSFPAPEDISEINLSDYGLTLFTTSQGIEVRLGRDGFRGKLARLNQVIRREGMGLKGARYIDLSLPHQVIVGR